MFGDEPLIYDCGRRNRVFTFNVLAYHSVKLGLEDMIFKPTSDQFTVRVASTIQEACELIETEFEYVTGEYTDGGKIFRKRK